MKLRIFLNTGNPRLPVDIVELDAGAYHIDPRLGTLTIVRGSEQLVVYAAQVWRSIVDVGAFKAAVEATRPPPEPARENTRRNQAPRPVQTA